MRLKMSSTSWRTRISGWMRPAARSRPGSVTSTLPAGGRLDSSAARRSCSALSISVLRALTAAPKARRSSWRQALERLHQGGDRARLAAQELVVDRLQGALGRGRGEARLELRAQRVDGGSVGHIKKKAGRKTRLPFTYPAFSYAAGSAALACEATFANAAVCGDRHVGQHLAVERDAGGLQAANQLRVGDAVLARGGVDAHHPEPAEVALLVLAPDVGVLRRGIDRFLGLAIQLALGLVEALRTRQQFLALGAPDGSAFHSRHCNVSLICTEASGGS